MTSPNSPSQVKENSSDSHYFVVVAAVVIVLLLTSNLLMIGCCSRRGLVATVKRFLQSLGILSGSSEDDRISRLIPPCTYRKEKAAAESECPVCLMAFVEGEDVRQMPECKHSFHVQCIDMWLCSHSNCPMCRADVLPAMALQGHHTTTTVSEVEAREETGYSRRSLIESGSMTGVVVNVL